MVFPTLLFLLFPPIFHSGESCSMVMKRWDVKSPSVVFRDFSPYVRFSVGIDDNLDNQGQKKQKATKTVIGKTEKLGEKKGSFSYLDFFTFPRPYDSVSYIFVLTNLVLHPEFKGNHIFENPVLAVKVSTLQEGQSHILRNRDWEIEVQLQCGERAITRCLIWDDAFSRLRGKDASSSSLTSWRDSSESWSPRGETRVNVDLDEDDMISVHRMADGDSLVGHDYIMLLTSEWRNGLRARCFWTLGAGISEDKVHLTIHAPDLVHAKTERQWTESGKPKIFSSPRLSVYFPTFSDRVWHEAEYKGTIKSIGYDADLRMYNLHFRPLAGSSKRLTSDGVKYMKKLLSKMRVKNSTSLDMKRGEFVTQHLFGDQLGGLVTHGKDPKDKQNSISCAFLIYSFNEDFIQNADEVMPKPRNPRRSRLFDLFGTQGRTQGIPKPRNPLSSQSFNLGAAQDLPLSPEDENWLKFLIKNKQ